MKERSQKRWTILLDSTKRWRNCRGCPNRSPYYFQSCL